MYTCHKSFSNPFTFVHCRLGISSTYSPASMLHKARQLQQHNKLVPKVLWPGMLLMSYNQDRA